MGLFTPSESPAVIIKEIDLTGGVPNVQTTTAAYVGDFNWGPVEVPTIVNNESTLVSIFAAPDKNNAVDFHTANSFLTYSNRMYVMRGVDSDAANAFDSDAASAAPIIKNRDHFDNNYASLDSDGHTFVAKYAGELGNSIKIEMCPFDSADTIFDAWAYSSEFDQAPSTSDFAASRGASNDEVHVVVIDQDGEISGTPGEILERFPFVSLASNAKNADGSTNYLIDVLNKRSSFVWAVGFDSNYTTANAGTPASSGKNYKLTTAATKSVSLVNGVNSGALGAAEYINGYNLIQDTETYEVDFLIAPPLPASSDTADAIAESLITLAAVTRKDCVAVIAPPRDDVIDTINPVNDTVEFFNGLASSSHYFPVNQHFKIFDKFNDEFIWIPASGATAGVMALSDYNTAPWFSPAGTRRGVYYNVIDLAYNPSKADRDTLYKANVNSIVNLPGQGITLFGDKTGLRRPSAFDRINVRRLFTVLERAIGRAARDVLFQLNDEFTRAEFVNIVEPTLRDVQGRRGITDFRVVCDETNNTPDVIDRNEFVATIFIKPARSINYVTLNFVATRTGVDFEEVVGRQF